MVFNKKEYNKLWNKNNKNKIREYYIKNKNKYKAYIKEYNKNYYLKNKERRLKEIKQNQKDNKYKYEKNPIRKIKYNIRARSRQRYPFKNQPCFYCDIQATERHHYTNPIEADKFYFVCKKCHIEQHNKIKI